MKTVFSNQQCAHIWAQQSQESGQGSKGSIYFEGKTIYSYGRHFPIAHFMQPSLVLFTVESYGNATSTHIAYTHRAIPGGVRVLSLPGTVIQSIVKGGKLKDNKDALTAYYAALIRDNLIKASRARSANVITYHKGIAFRARKNAEAMAAEFKAVNLKEIPMVENFDPKAYAAEVKAREEKARKKWDKRLKAAMAAWVAGEACDMPPSQFPETLMRVQGEEVVTSKGARFGVKHALRAWKALKAIIPVQEETAVNIAIGDFRIDSVTTEGVKAGCHFIKWPEVKRMAAVLGVQ